MFSADGEVQRTPQAASISPEPDEPGRPEIEIHFALWLPMHFVLNCARVQGTHRLSGG